MKLSDLNESIDDYKNQTGKPLKEIRVSIENYKSLVRNLEKDEGWDPISEDKILLSPITYRGISITWGVEI